MMFWEILATIFSGFLLAGLVMPIRLFYKRAPKWIVPVAAGLGMIGFQVYTEYAWANDAIAKLPDQSIVVAKVEKSTWFRPWSYVKPQVFQFVVLDKAVQQCIHLAFLLIALILIWHLMTPPIKILSTPFVHSFTQSKRCLSQASF